MRKLPGMRGTLHWLLMGLSLGVAGYALAVYTLLPLGHVVHPDMREVYRAHPLAIYLHVFGAMFALALGPFQFLNGLRARRPVLHRWMGRLYLALGVGVGGTAGLFMAFHAFGGSLARSGFALLALAWLYTGWQAWRAIRARDIARHRLWMRRNFALSLAAVTLRVLLPAALAAGFSMEQAYPVIAWLCWVPNLVLALRLEKPDIDNNIRA